MKKLYSVRTIILAGSLLLQLNTLCFHSRGAAGDVDLSFDPGSGVNGAVRIVVLQPDGKVIIVGEFTTVKGLARSGIARLNADGSGDATFNAGTNANTSGYLSSVALQSDGKVLIGGSRIARLNANGSLDGSFTLDIGFIYSPEVHSLVVQSDGKVLIGGLFSTVNGANRNGIARLNANGSLDSSFDPGSGVNGLVGSIVVQSDGKVLIGGYFFTVNGTNRYSIARLNANGSLDSSFNSGPTATGGGFSSVAVQPDGKVLIGGYGIARLKSDGSPDTNFISLSILDYDGYSAGWLESVAVQSDGKVLISGEFLTVNGTNRNGIARLNANGSLDSSFNPGTVLGYANEISSIAVQSDGKVLIGGYSPGQIARVNTDGSLDGSFRPSSAVLGTVFSLVVQSDGKVLVGELGFIGYYLYPGSGAFTFVNGTNRYGSARLNADGSLDSTFISNANFNPNLAAFIDSRYCNSVCVGACYQAALPTAVLVQSDGKVLIGGYVETTSQADDCFDQIYTPFCGRFNADGSRDTSFNPNPGTVGFTLALQPDGKIVVGPGPVRLNADGSLDSSFNPGTGANGGVSSVAVQSDGKVLIGGSFTAVNGTNRHGIARLNSNGSVDGSFNPGTGVFGAVSSIALQSDGKVLIGGLFTTVNGTNRNNIARLNANGGLDSSFNPGTGADGLVRSIALQPDGNVLIGGDFTFVNGAVRPRVARLYGDSVAPALSIVRSNAFVILSWPVTGLNFHLQESTNLFPAAWSPVSQAAVTNAGQVSVTVPTTVGRKFFRLKSP
jgi:hypothetical protein